MAGNYFKYRTELHFYNTANMEKRKMVHGHNDIDDTTIFRKFDSYKRKNHYIYRFDYVVTFEQATGKIVFHSDY